ncbi:MAG TPA: VIT domain-containing protein [Chitinophagaceae bacterium]|nr:VIT domain-containing protein [Chitinophagaceae bacterium]
MRKLLYTTVIILLLTNESRSQLPDEPIKIRSFSVNIRASLFTATTTINIELFNPNNKVLDGEYSFSLNSGQVITGFALDINGNMREGVIVDKQRGRVAYENTTRRRIDPGLLEMTTSDNYRIRVYPMPAKGTRKIRIIITEQLSIKNNSLVYTLPLDVKESVLNFDLAINVFQAREQPLANEGIIHQRSFLKQDTIHTLNFNDKDLELKKPISFRIPIKENKVCFFNIGANKYFAAHIKPTIEHGKNIIFSTVTVFWDLSASGSKRNILKDISFLDAFCKEENVGQLIIVTFSNSVQEIREFNLNKKLSEAAKRFLEKNIFDGGTQLGILDCAKYNSDAYLLFSDGLSNYGDEMLKTNAKPVYCISSSASANHTLLKKISNKTNGRYINLNAETVNESIVSLSKAENRLLSAVIGDIILNVNSQLPASFTEWITISGKTGREMQSFDLDFGDMGAVLRKENVPFNSSGHCDSTDIARLILMQQFAMLQNEANMEIAVAAFASRNKFVSNTTSFIVLDNLEDYIQYGIEPPVDLEEKYLKRMGEITQRKEQQQRDEANAMINNLKTSVTQYNERVSWWNKSESLIVFDDVIKKNNEIKTMISQRSEEIKTNNSNGNDGNFDNFKGFGNGTLNEVVVTGYGIQRRRDMTGAVSIISSSQLSGLGSMNVAQALAGRVAGVQVIEHSAPGGASQIFIRGGLTSPGGGQPLYIVDGVPMEGDIATLITVNEIESISVLKGVQASSLYGSRASNGAIVIIRKRAFGNNAKSQIVKYKDLEDVDYVSELKDAGKDEMYRHYLNMKNSLGEEPSFYFDAAEVMYQNGDKEKALGILTNLLEIDYENHQLLRAVGYMFENWGMYEEAVSVYQKVLAIKEEEPQSYRDLALAYEKSGDLQAAVELLYISLTKNWYQYENRYRGLRSILLTEMNSIIARNKKEIDLSEINTSIIKPLPVDLRIVVDWNKDETDIDLHIVEPGGEECYYNHRQSKAGGRMAEDFTQGYGPEEYQIKNAVKGKYSILVNYYGDRYQKKQVPSFIKLTIYKNYGKSNQTVTTQTLIMDNQTGKIEIGELKW